MFGKADKGKCPLFCVYKYLNTSEATDNVINNQYQKNYPSTPGLNPTFSENSRIRSFHG